MKIRTITLSIFILIIGLVSCKDDDDGSTVEIEENDRTEQQVIDNDSIIGYLNTHYYNSGDFTIIENTNPNVKDLVFTELLEGETVPEGSTLLIDAVETKTTVYLETDYEYYILKLNQGGGTKSPTFADDVFTVYEGFTLDGDIFDSNLEIVSSFDLLAEVIKGWGLVFPEFNVATSFVENNDGTVEYLNHGAGAMFIPSGLGYYAQFTVGTQYAPLIFKFNLYGMSVNDHDFDSIPSYLEDLNGDQNVTVDDDDTDGDNLINAFDSDDDGDGISTIYEDLEDTDLEVDSDGDGDPTNDKNGDGDPTNDDTDGDGIPNYLDSDDAESNQD